MKAVLVLNGEAPRPERLRALAEEAPVYAADGGSRICVKSGVRPEWVMGDGDSMGECLPKGWVFRSAPDQNATDFQKVLQALPPEVDTICVLGGCGGRLDHAWTNLLIASSLPIDVRIWFEHGDERLCRVTSSCPWRGAPAIGRDLSLLPVGRVEGVNTQGLQWNLQEEVLAPDGLLGQSNRVIGAVSVEVSAGSLFVWFREEEV
jgi:thiamine pyrophosphokinase